MFLHQAKSGKFYQITSINGDRRFLSRVTAIGLTLDHKIKVIKNRGKLPILVYGRDTLIALNIDESKKIMVREIQ